ncbi:TRAP transporter large permease [Salisediminibacterium beveridgei]|uniref:TRAP-type C4-dicarboxylate transport system, large permease component n=1 Tax=Salisediminibacterium beveridgei TaxID=632773 RepID=A0A1D7QRY8_9BACI|nr:TRAP transporter large permease subunit [Salisediminibacterium beveridgei]AOM81777.1 TRAP-type C4-dicarboxylate transport system, large permease component [Salisediminibacterium beveridgei]
MIWIMILSFFLLIILGIPIAFAMGGSALLYFLVAGIPMEMFAQRFFSNTQSFAFLAIPFFILAGNLMIHGNIAQRIIGVADAMVRQLPGGLGCVSVVTSMGMAGVSGSSVADAASTGSVLIPEMKRKGYSANFSAAINASSSVVGIIIPPSSTMIIIAWLANLSVGEMFIAGIIPGILVGLAYLGTTVLIALKRGYPSESKPTLREFAGKLRHAALALVLPIILIGAIVSGIATATEAASIAVMYALIIGLFFYRTLTLKTIIASLRETVRGTSIVMVTICASMIFTWVLISEGIPRMISDALQGLGLPGWGLLLVMILIMLLAGMIMELVPNLFLFIPIFMPIATDVIGMDPMHFAMIMLVTLALGMFTPPVGATLFISCYIAKVKIEQTTKDVLPYFGAGIAVVLIISFLPFTILWLPSLF